MAEKNNFKPVKGIRKPGAARSGSSAVSAPKKEKEKEVKPVSKPVKKPAKRVPKANTELKRTKTEGDPTQPRIKRNFSDGKFSRKKKVPLVILAIVGLFAVTAFTSYLSYTYLVDRYENPITEDSIILDKDTTVTFKIKKGANSSDVAAALKKADLISSEFLFKLLSNFNGFDSKYSAGTHYLSKGLNYDEIMTILASEPETVKVTFPEGFTVTQIADRLEANNVVSKKEFLSAVNTIDVSSYPFVSKNDSKRDYKLEGFLFPDTYEFDIAANVEDVIYKMLNNFSTRYLPEYYTRAEELGFTVDQVVILASIVEREAKLSKERAKIAGVYINRLKSDEYKLLQCEATVQYIHRLLNDGVTPEEITAEMTEVDNPYNTYKYEGLPPGAICNPSSASIKAVLNYEEHGYYFYVVSKSNRRAHVFSETFEQHKQAIEENRVTEEAEA